MASMSSEWAFARVDRYKADVALMTKYYQSRLRKHEKEAKAARAKLKDDPDNAILLRTLDILEALIKQLRDFIEYITSI